MKEAVSPPILTNILGFPYNDFSIFKTSL